MEFVRRGEIVRIYGRSKPLPYREGMKFVRGGKIVRSGFARGLLPSFCFAKIHLPHEWEANGRYAPEGGEWNSCEEGKLCGFTGGASPSPTEGEWRLCADGSSCGIGVRLALSVSRCEPPVSLRLGHARGLTAVQAVIQHPRAAALLAREGKKVATLPKVGNEFCARRGDCADLREELTVCVAHSALTLPRENGVCARRGVI